MADVPQDLRHDVERRSVRVVLLDARGDVLLMRTVDPDMPEIGEWWELPGGGVEAGESVAETAIREIFEETGIRIDASQVGQPTWSRSATYLRRRRRVLQHEVVVAVRLDGARPEVSGEGRTPSELEEYVEARWWPLDELVVSGLRFFPGRLPVLVETFLSGAPIDEPFEHWN